MKPSLRNLFMKKLTRDRVVPIISANVSWLIFETVGWGLPSLPKFTNRSSKRCQPLFTGIEELVEQIFLNPTIAGQQIGHAHLGTLRLIAAVFVMAVIRPQRRNRPHPACVFRRAGDEAVDHGGVEGAVDHQRPGDSQYRRAGSRINAFASSAPNSR